MAGINVVKALDPLAQHITYNSDWSIKIIYIINIIFLYYYHYCFNIVKTARKQRLHEEDTNEYVRRGGDETGLVGCYISKDTTHTC